MKKNKTLTIVLVILIILSLAAAFGFAFAYRNAVNKADQRSAEEQSDISPKPHFDGKNAPHREPPSEGFKSYLIECSFEGMIDSNSFEVSDEKGNIYQLRTGGRTANTVSDTEIGESLSVECHYNEDGQLIADKILLRNLK